MDITFSNVDPELLNEQRLALVKVLEDNDYPGVLWGLVEMLDDWYDRQYSPVEV